MVQHDLADYIRNQRKEERDLAGHSMAMEISLLMYSTCVMISGQFSRTIFFWASLKLCFSPCNWSIQNRTLKYLQITSLIVYREEEEHMCTRVHKCE